MTIGALRITGFALSMGLLGCTGGIVDGEAAESLGDTCATAPPMAGVQSGEAGRFRARTPDQADAYDAACGAAFQLHEGAAPIPISARLLDDSALQTAASCTSTTLRGRLFAASGPLGAAKSVTGQWTGSACELPALKWAAAEVPTNADFRLMAIASNRGSRLPLVVDTTLHEGIARFPASAETTTTLGVDHWALWKTAAKLDVLEGFDAKDRALFFIDMHTASDAAGHAVFIRRVLDASGAKPQSGELVIGANNAVLKNTMPSTGAAASIDATRDFIAYAGNAKVRYDDCGVLEVEWVLQCAAASSYSYDNDMMDNPIATSEGLINGPMALDACFGLKAEYDLQCNQPGPPAPPPDYDGAGGMSSGEDGPNSETDNDAPPPPPPSNAGPADGGGGASGGGSEGSGAEGDSDMPPPSPTDYTNDPGDAASGGNPNDTDPCGGGYDTESVLCPWAYTGGILEGG